MPGLALRLDRMIRHGYYAIAALDHGLSDGGVDGLDSSEAIAASLQRVVSSGMRAVVLNHGLLAGADLPAPVAVLSGVSVIVQTYGCPAVGIYGGTRRLLATVEGALAAGADAISVQLAVDEGGVGPEVEQIAALANRARSLGLPSLLMVNRSIWPSADEFVRVVRAMCEVPVDLVKATPGDCLAHLEPGALSGFPKPVLLGGGPLQSEFCDTAALTATAGFSGVCLGRNLFQADDPQQVVALLDNAFDRSLQRSRRSGAARYRG